ncbi:phosphonate C-P lyase system protein PhnG [Mesorhizobium sp. CAU 1732]|uniref:phosphonate C-P lyase system protein PhnG n=1 Tax=Mesorhizobium sp. CAU 1732 TaxID=3140358 RepID=UPI0032604543
MTRDTSSDPGEHEGRRALMSVLASTPMPALRQVWDRAGIAVEHVDIRRPETGLVTVRGRIGGGGSAFNVGEATVTRASVRLATGETGHSYALGRDIEKARLCAVLDALWQRAETRETVRSAVFVPLTESAERDDARRRAETAATKVDFFTMVRGED